MRLIQRNIQVVVTLLATQLLSISCTSDSVGDQKATGKHGQDSGATPTLSDDGQRDAGDNEKDSDDKTPFVTPDPGCDLTGKWISIRRTVNIALGGVVKQATHNWGYWEIAQNGTQVTVTRGVKCGFEVIDISDVSFTTVIITPEIWDAMTQYVSNTGRRATYEKVGTERCALHFDRYYIVRGATVDYFADPTIPLSEAESEATQSRPGWEDWDQDGNPGITFRVVGVASGQIYAVQRDWFEYQGTTTRNADNFKLKAVWQNEQLVIDQDPPSLPSADSYPSTDEKDHFIIFNRVDNLQQWDLNKKADDVEVCVKMRQLKDTLIQDPLIESDRKRINRMVGD